MQSESARMYAWCVAPCLIWQYIRLISCSSSSSNCAADNAFPWNQSAERRSTRHAGRPRRDPFTVTVRLCTAREEDTEDCLI